MVVKGAWSIEVGPAGRGGQWLSRYRSHEVCCLEAAPGARLQAATARCGGRKVCSANPHSKSHFHIENHMLSKAPALSTAELLGTLLVTSRFPKGDALPLPSPSGPLVLTCPSASQQRGLVLVICSGCTTHYVCGRQPEGSRPVGAQHRH